jgi:crotonobetainyl-CoA:carnitine CoA-transferase CaiB-like acyl-CoA transferase
MARIIEITDLAGAYATRLLAEAGHEVIRIESPGGDGLRNSPPFLSTELGAEGSCCK